MSANAARGEASIALPQGTLALRPTFAALVAAEAELGPLFALVERAAEGRLGLMETVALIDHVARPRAETIDRARIGEALVAQGLAATSPLVALLIGEILRGR